MTDDTIELDRDDFGHLRNLLRQIHEMNSGDGPRNVGKRPNTQRKASEALSILNEAEQE